MEKTKLSSKGQIVIPKSVRDAHGWTEGTEFTIEDMKEGVFLRSDKAYPFPRTTIDEVVGCANYKGPPKTIEEMNEGVTREARRMWRKFEKQKR